MIIRTHVNHSKEPIKTQSDNASILVKEEKKVIKENNHKKKNKKTIPTPIVEEPIVVEEKVEDEDLNKWFEEHTED